MNPQPTAQGLNTLPPPPKGQTGVSLDSFNHLPPPPKGQTGMTLAQIKGQAPQQAAAPMPLASETSGSFLSNLRTAGKDMSVGLVKGVGGFAKDTLSGLQGMGQRIKAMVETPGGNFDPANPLTPRPEYLKNLQQQQANTGFKSLDDSTPEGQRLNKVFTPSNRSEQTGDILANAGILATGLSGGVAENLVAKGKGLLQDFNAAREAKATADATAKVGEMIAPKPTPTQAKIAQSQGRLVQGKEPTLFKAGTPDKILPTKKSVSATETIIKSIPNAQKMSPSELYSAVDKTITDTATKLRPQMEATPIKPETIQKINTDWQDLKKSQMADAPATEEANVAKRQAKFESLLQKSGNESHADLWDTRINYDNSIPDNVKKATSISSDSLQLQKEEWLQNRKILNDAIDSSAKPEFQKMSDLYEAKTGLNSKAKVNDAKMSKVNQFLKDNPKVSSALGGATIYEIAKHLGVPLP